MQVFKHKDWGSTTAEELLVLARQRRVYEEEPRLSAYLRLMTVSFESEQPTI
jgi:hypothetical protein